jgi:hypothetical protein
MMIHNSISSGKDDVAKLSRWEDLVAPVLNLVDWNVKSWRDDSALVNSSKELDDDFSGSVVIDDFEFSNVSFLLHNFKELDEDLGARSNKDLSLTSSFGIDNGFEGIGKYVHSHVDRVFINF